MLTVLRMRSWQLLYSTPVTTVPEIRIHTQAYLGHLWWSFLRKSSEL